MKKIKDLFGDLFSSTEPILKEGQILQPRKDFEASYSDLANSECKGEYKAGEECIVKKDMRLKFHSEDDLCLYFIVRCNYLLQNSKKEVHAQDQSIIFIFKSDFDIKKYWKCVNHQN